MDVKKKRPIHVTKGATAEQIRKTLGILDKDREEASRIIKELKERGVIE